MTYFASKRVTPQAPRRRSLGAAPAQTQSGSGKLVTALASRADEVWPDVLHWLYETEEYELSANGLNKLGVWGLQDQFPSLQDLTSSMKIFDEVATFTAVQVNGGVNDPTNPSKQAKHQRPVRRDHDVPDPTHRLHHRRRPR